MNFLITGGAGSVGQDLAALLLAKGHAVRVLDKRVDAFPRPRPMGLELVQARLDDAPAVRKALEGIDVVIHLAWSFSDDPIELVEDDLKGHVVLLEACVTAGIARLFYTSTAVAYGKPVQTPLAEDAPPLVEQSRKPFYAAAKLAAEKFALAFWKAKGLPVTLIRFWWSFGDKIGGRHLRDMIALAQSGQPLRVPADAGGSFLDHADLAHAILRATEAPCSIGHLFNLATVYVEWQDVARMIIAATGSASPLQIVPNAEWDGAAFLADPWNLSTAKAEALFGYASLFSTTVARERLAKAIARGGANVGANVKQA
jgi:UDP-glucose 4-epimerase